MTCGMFYHLMCYVSTYGIFCYRTYRQVIFRAVGPYVAASCRAPILSHTGMQLHICAYYFENCYASANIFINPRPACRETEKGGEGQRDTQRHFIL